MQDKTGRDESLGPHFNQQDATSSQPISESAQTALWIDTLESIWAEPAPISWVVENLIPAESVVMVAGESGCGKSTFLLALALAVAHGEPFLGQTTTGRPVLIVDKENARHVYHQRTERMHLEQTELLKVWGIWSPSEPEGPNSKKIIEFVRARKPLIVFDSLVAFHPGNEQDATETRKYMQLFRNLSGYGATVALIHHTGKGENTKEYRGSSDIKASVDLNFVLTAKEPRLRHLELKPVKCREGKVETLQITFNEDTGKFEVLGDAERIAVEQLLRMKPSLNHSQVFAELHGKVSDHKLREILKNGVEKGTFQMEKGLNNANCYTVKGA